MFTNSTGYIVPTNFELKWYDLPKGHKISIYFGETTIFGADRDMKFSGLLVS